MDNDGQKGSVLESYGRVSISEGFPYPQYAVKDPQFSQEEAQLKDALVSLILGKVSFEQAEQSMSKVFPKKFLADFRERIIKPITYNDFHDSLMATDDFNSTKLALMSILQEYFPKMRNFPLVASLSLADSVGYGVLAPFIEDEGLEEIMVNGYERNIFVFHKKYGHCRTNIAFSSKKSLDLILQKIAKSVGKTFDADRPLLDARLPDGNRANATFSFVTPFGPSLTIRKFSSVPMSIIQLIKNSTFSSELAAFMWVMVEGVGIEPMNIIVSGGSGSGKTTTLNALSGFIRQPERIISIEDTLEIQLGKRENWIQMESRPKMKGQEGVSMDDLLKNAMRMRPDRLIVGEVRSEEAQTMFLAMDTGHKGILGTLHSNSAKEMLLRLKAEPMSVPESMIPLLNIIVVQFRIYVKGKGIERRVLAVTEVSSMESQALLSNVYEWDRRSDSIRRTDVPMNVLDILAAKTLKPKKEIEREIYVRQKVLEWMLKNNISAAPDVENLIQQYYYRPESVLEKVLSSNSS
ncbi:MAG TPA: ATPase, T2SS/T4P/T4SS family [archaeon]|nr:ATPase, T2SS/T4P/T4SS family [archaeon]